MVLNSFLFAESSFVYPPSLIPKEIQFGSYVALFKDPIRPFLQWILNTFVVAITTAILCIIVGTFTALSLSRFSFRGKASVGVSILAVRMLPRVLLVIPLYVLINSIGLLNKLSSLVIADLTFALPLSIWMLKGFFDSIPREIEECAMIDGCTRIGAFLRIMVPLSAPGIAASAMYAFIFAWNEFINASTFLSSSDKFTLSVGLRTYIEQHSVAWNEMMAAAVLTTLPVVILFLVLQKYFVAGITAGAVKG
jgi:multiple sugar transport system permease protein